MKNFKKILGNQQGMSLVEVIVAAAISVIISGAVMKTNESGIKGMNAITTKMSLSVWKSTILLNKFNDPNTCMANFTKISYTKADGAPGPTDPPVSGLYNLDGTTTFASINDPLINATGGDWKLVSVNYQAFKEDSAGSTKGRCDATIIVESLKSGYGTKQKTIKIPIGCTLDAGLASIQSCSASSDGMDTLWTQQLASGSDLEYVFRNNNVMIGPSTQSIAAPFEVKYEFQDEWPVAGSGSGIKPAIKISQPNPAFEAAMVLGNNALYGDTGGCLNIAADNAGVAVVNNSFCLNLARISSPNSVSSTGTYASAISSHTGSANGNYSVFMGSHTAGATGDYSHSISSSYGSVTGTQAGMIASSNSQVSGASSMAIGSNFAEPSGANSAVIGSTGTGTYPSRASGASSVVLGASNVSVTGIRSVGMGEDNIVSGQNALVAGYNNTVSGRGAMSLGYNNIISGDNSFSAGYNNKVSGTGSVALGYNADVSGSASLAGGTSSAKGWASFAFGQESVSNASKSITMGWSSVNNGQNAKIFADHTDVSGSYSVAMGYDLSVTGGASMALGFGGSSSNRTIESQSRHFTGMFDNGYEFKTDPYDQNNEQKNVSIGKDGHLGVGVSMSPYSKPSYLNTYWSSLSETPRVAIDGNLQIEGDILPASGSLSIGTDNDVSGTGNIFLGYRNKVDSNRNWNYALGSNNDFTSNGSIILGFNNEAAHSAKVFGENNKAKGMNSFAIGDGAETSSVATEAMTIAGGYNHVTTPQINSTGGSLLIAFYQGVRVKSGSSGGTKVNPGASSWTAISDRNRKENFEAVSGEYVLQSIQRMEIPRWTYKHEERNYVGEQVEHIGPMAQEFYKAFNIGFDNKTIGTSDISGVNMKAVQALVNRTDKLQEENNDLKMKNLELEQRLARLEKIIQNL